MQHYYSIITSCESSVVVEKTECENSLAFVCVGVDSTGLYAQWRHEEPLGPHGCWVRESSTVNSVHTNSSCFPRNSERNNRLFSRGNFCDSLERLQQAWPTSPRNHLSTETWQLATFSWMIGCPARQDRSGRQPQLD